MYGVQLKVRKLITMPNNKLRLLIADMTVLERFQTKFGLNFISQEKYIQTKTLNANIDKQNINFLD